MAVGAGAWSANDARRRIDGAAMVLVVASTVVQCVALVAADDRLAAGSAARHAFSVLELALVAGLLVVGRQIVRWSDRVAPGGVVPGVARLCLASLGLCALGDVVNRNFLEQSFQWDDAIRHSYLITSIWCFLPGYALVTWANRVATRRSVSRRQAVATVAVAAAIGVAAALANPIPGAGAYPSAMVLAYTASLAALGGSALWLGRTFGWARSTVAVVGCLLALVADALIGAFWIAEDRFPTVEHVNWILYFASLAMIQRLPFLVADAGADAAGAQVA